MTSTVLDLAASHGLELGSPEFAAVLDEADELRSMRERFHIPPVDPTAGAESARVVYLCGNSLGCQPKNTSVYVNQELEAWQRLGVEGHWDAPRPWLTTDEFVYKLVRGLPTSACSTSNRSLRRPSSRVCVCLYVCVYVCRWHTAWGRWTWRLPS